VIFQVANHNYSSLYRFVLWLIPGGNWLASVGHGVEKLIADCVLLLLAVGAVRYWWIGLPEGILIFRDIVCGFIAVPFLAGISIAMLPFGIDASLLSIIYDVRVQIAPPGKWPIKEFGRQSSLSLAHCSIYNDPAVVADIAEDLHRFVLLSTNPR
jgi:hypothetical protein